MAAAYSCNLGAAGTNGSLYFRFMSLVQRQVGELLQAGFKGNPLKGLDEYNYCTQTNKWGTSLWP